jgi:hypothetical protein
LHQIHFPLDSQNLKTKAKMFTEPQKSSSSFAADNYFDVSLDLSSAFELFVEISESTLNVKRDREHQLLSTQHVIGCKSILKRREETLTQSNARHNSSKVKKGCNRVSVDPQDKIQILKCNSEMTNAFSFSNYIDMVDVREHLQHNESFIEFTDDDVSIGSDFSVQTIDSIEYTRAKLPHLCHHDVCQ